MKEILQEHLEIVLQGYKVLELGKGQMELVIEEGSIKESLDSIEQYKNEEWYKEVFRTINNENLTESERERIYLEEINEALCIFEDTESDFYERFINEYAKVRSEYGYDELCAIRVIQVNDTVGIIVDFN